MRTLQIALVAAMVALTGCVGAETDSADEQVSTDEQGIKSGDLSECTLNVDKPEAYNAVIDGRVRTVTDAIARLDCPEPRTTLLKADIKVDKAFWSDDTLAVRETAIKTQRVRVFRVRYDGCVATGKFHDGNGVYAKAWAYGIHNGKVVDELKDRSPELEGNCP